MNHDQKPSPGQSSASSDDVTSQDWVSEKLEQSEREMTEEFGPVEAEDDDDEPIPMLDPTSQEWVRKGLERAEQKIEEEFGSVDDDGDLDEIVVAPESIVGIPGMPPLEQELHIGDSDKSRRADVAPFDEEGDEEAD